MRRTTSTSSALLTLSLGALLAGCAHTNGSAEATDDGASTGDAPGSDTTTDEPEPEPEPGTTTAEPEPETGTTTDEPEPGLEQMLDGRWISESCEPTPQADGSTLYFRRDFTLSPTTWSITGTLFGDERCTFPLLTLDIGGDYAIVGPAAGVDEAHEADFDRDSIALTPHVEDFVALFDGAGCGAEPWAIDVQQDVTEAGCAFIPSSAACPIEYDLVSLAAPERLFFGLRPVDGDMCSPRTRPAALGDSPVLRQ
ncbi:MAG: hypothetical protein AB1Z98_22685 [Nannocystaceae bacterium]